MANDSSVADADHEVPQSEDSPALDIEETGENVDGELDDEIPRPDRRIAMAARFQGPLPPPKVLADYDEVIPGLAREIVNQWEAETAHRHRTIDSLRKTDHEAMVAYYKSDRLGQILAAVIFAGIVGVAVLAIALNSQAIGVSAIITGGASVIWAMRRHSDAPQPPTDLSNGDALERPDGGSGSN
jgi:uncharacterized membrane protein